MAPNPVDDKSSTASRQNAGHGPAPRPAPGRRELTPDSHLDPDSHNSQSPHQPIGRSGRVRRPPAFHNAPRARRASTSSLPTVKSLLHHDSANVNRSEIITEPFPFFSLPPEVRNMVYRNFARYPRGVVKAKSMPTRLQPFLANRKLYDEASKLFYAENVFKFYSIYVAPGIHPFGPSLTRIRKCFMHLNGTDLAATAFIARYVEEFVTALLPHHALKYLLIRLLPLQLVPPLEESLERLRGITFAQIHLTMTSDRRLYTWRPPSTYALPSAILQNVPLALRRRQQYLERAMMSEPTRPRIPMAQTGGYVTDPRLTVYLKDPELRTAQMTGGWRSRLELYTYFGIDPVVRLRSDRIRVRSL
ncbi:MAG: hypothetical protein LQ345_005978 [Seirophora villosa]|nr:MAG: hypothetical protein LQ345_005978 [Seirophora villosa]